MTSGDESEDSDEFDSEDEDEFNSEASIVSTEVVENNNAKVKDVFKDVKESNRSMVNEAEKGYLLLGPLPELQVIN